MFTTQEAAILAIAEAATALPLGHDARAELSSARSVLDDELFAAVEWVVIMINTFSRVSILSNHPVGSAARMGRSVT